MQNKKAAPRCADRKAACRQNIPVNFVVKTSLAPTNPVTTTLYVVDEENVVEMVPQIPGQLGLDTPEQEAPASLKIIKFANG